MILLYILSCLIFSVCGFSYDDLQDLGQLDDLFEGYDTTLLDPTTYSLNPPANEIAENPDCDYLPGLGAACGGIGASENPQEVPPTAASAKPASPPPGVAPAVPAPKPKLKKCSVRVFPFLVLVSPLTPNQYTYLSMTHVGYCNPKGEQLCENGNVGVRVQNDCSDGMYGHLPMFIFSTCFQLASIPPPKLSVEIS